MRRVALMVPINKEKKILLQHRESGILIKPNHWAFFGGHIEDGEGQEDAAKREFQEELGIAASFPKFFKHDVVREFIGGKEETIERFFYTIPLDDDEADLKLRLCEGDGLGFFSRDNLKTLKMSSSDLAICYEIFDNLDILL